MNTTNDKMEVHYDLANFGDAEIGKHFESFKKARGLQKTSTKVAVSIRLDADVIDAFRAKGKGWQTQINSILRDSVLGS